MVRKINIIILFLTLSIAGFSQKKEIYRDTEVHGSLAVDDSMKTPFVVIDSLKLAGTVINEIIQGNEKLETDTLVVGISRIIDYHTLDQIDSIVIFNNVTGVRIGRLFPIGSSFIGDEFLFLPGDGSDENYLDINIDRDATGQIDYWWWSTDESQDLTFRVTPSDFMYSTNHLGVGDYSFQMIASDIPASTLLLFQTPFGSIRFKPQLSGSLTDGAPTNAEITAIVGATAALSYAGTQITIKDTDGSGFLYKVESDGTDWFYTIMPKAL